MGLNSIITERLKQFGLKLGVAETSTSGMVCSNLALLQNQKDVLQLGLVVNNLQAASFFGLETQDFICKENARKLAKLLVSEYNCDIALAIISTSNDPKLRDDVALQQDAKTKNYTGHSFISVYAFDKYNDFELKFKSEDDLKDRILITGKAVGELLSVVLALK